MRTARSVVAALVTALVAAVLAVAAEVGYQVAVAAAVNRFSVSHPHVGYSAYCGYALGIDGGGDVVSQWLFFAVPGFLLVGGVACLTLAYLKRSLGSPRRRLAVFAGLAEIAFAFVAGIGGFIWIAFSSLSCYD